MELIIEVTDQNIKEGIKKSTTLCPIAQAVRRETQAQYVHVDETGIYYSIEPMSNMRYKATWTYPLFNLMSQFDAGKEVEPITASVHVEKLGFNE